MNTYWASCHTCISWLPVPVTDCTTGVNGTNETQNGYSEGCLIINGQKAVNMSLEHRLLEQKHHLNDVEKVRLAKYFDCLMEMDLSMKATVPR